MFVNSRYLTSLFIFKTVTSERLKYGDDRAFLESYAAFVADSFKKLSFSADDFALFHSSTSFAISD